jgi:hypothetical protein
MLSEAQWLEGNEDRERELAARHGLEGYCERELANAREHDPRYRTMTELLTADSDPDRPF